MQIQMSLFRNFCLKFALLDHFIQKSSENSEYFRNFAPAFQRKRNYEFD